MKPILFLFLSCIIFSCTNSGTDATSAKAEETKAEREEREGEKPLDFLQAKGSYRKNMIGQWVLEGNITNSAMVTTYKDVVFKIYYYSKTETALGTEEKTFFEYCKPNSDTKFKIKTGGFEGTGRIAFEIISAGVVRPK